tara:strand:+ start:1442 stop:3148 length:1707 start_codon:yes stop_codon:yes gene_type:complete
MSKKLIRFNSQLKTNNLAKKTMHVGIVNQKSLSADYYVIENVCHMVRDSVMNGILYTAANFDELSAELMKSNARIPAPLSHPSDENGGFVDANDPITFPAHNIGGFDADWRVNGDKLVSNTYIPVDSIDKPKEDNQWLSDRINNKQPIDRSTGLYLNYEEEAGIGKDGEPYTAKTTVIYELNHSAILNPDIEPGAKNNGESVGMFTNSKGAEVEIEDVELINNASSPAMNLPLANVVSQWDATKSEQDIRMYTESLDAPTSNYRKFFLSFNIDAVDSFESYHLPFAVIIGGVPHANKAALENAKAKIEGMDISDEDKVKANKTIDAYLSKFESETASNAGLFKKTWNKIKGLFANESSHDEVRELLYKKLNENITEDEQYSWPQDVFANYFIYSDDSGKLFKQEYVLAEGAVYFNGIPHKVERVTEYKIINQNGDRIMRDKIKAALTAANVKTDGLDDDALFLAYNSLTATKPETKNNSEDIALQITTTVNALLAPLQDQLNANANAEQNQLAEQVVTLDMGIDADAAKAMSVNALKSVLAKNGVVAFNSGGFRKQEPVAQLDAAMPE